MAHVVVIGAKPETVEALLAAGHEVTLLYEAWEERRVASVRPRARHYCAIDSLGSLESLWSALHQIGALSHPIDAVVSNCETAIVSGAVLGKLLGARALDPEVALRCRDKAVQKAAWHRAGVPTARYVVVPDVLAAPDSALGLVRDAQLRVPLFVKPVAGYGTRGVACVRELDELLPTIARLVEANPSMRRLMIEEGVEGDEWHFDGIVMNGVVDTLHVSRYVTPLIETKKGYPNASISFPPSRHPALYDAARGLTQRALTALGHERGVFHFEVFAKPGTLSFVAGELAARIGGNYISAMIARAIGVDLWVAAGMTLLDEAIPRVPAISDRVFAVTALPATAGAVNRVRPEDLMSMKGVIEIVPTLPVGATMGDMRESSVTCVGVALVEGTDYDDCHSRIAKVAHRVLEINER